MQCIAYSKQTKNAEPPRTPTMQVITLHTQFDWAMDPSSKTWKISSLRVAMFTFVQLIAASIANTAYFAFTFVPLASNMTRTHVKLQLFLRLTPSSRSFKSSGSMEWFGKKRSAKRVFNLKKKCIFELHLRIRIHPIHLFFMPVCSWAQGQLLETTSAVTWQRQGGNTLVR